MRRFGEPVDPFRQYTKRAGAYAVLLRGSDVLLTHQQHPTPEFQLPGGGIDPGESPIRALHREVQEETGWKISQTRRMGAYRRFTYMPDYDLWAEKICSIYIARPSISCGDPGEDGHTAVWMPLELAVETVASSGDQFALSQVARGVFSM